MKRLPLLAVLLIVLGVVVFAACKPRPPKDVIAEADMEEILYDYHLAQGAAEATGGDVEKNRYLFIQDVFRKHGVTEAEFDSSMIYYSAHADLLMAMYERLGARYGSEGKGMGVGLSNTEMYASLSAYGDTANIWSGRPIIVLQNDVMHNLTTYSIPADTSFHAGDTFQFNFNSHFLTAGECSAYVFFTVEYTDGEKQTQYRHLMCDGETMIPIPCAEGHRDRVAKRIVLTVYQHPDPSGKHAYCLLTRPSILRIHSKKEDADKAETKPAEAKDSVDEAPAPAIDLSAEAAAAQPDPLNKSAYPTPEQVRANGPAMRAH